MTEGRKRGVIERWRRRRQERERRVLAAAARSGARRVAAARLDARHETIEENVGQ